MDNLDLNGFNQRPKFDLKFDLKFFVSFQKKKNQMPRTNLLIKNKTKKSDTVSRHMITRGVRGYVSQNKENHSGFHDWDDSSPITSWEIDNFLLDMPKTLIKLIIM